LALTPSPCFGKGNSWKEKDKSSMKQTWSQPKKDAKREAVLDETAAEDTLSKALGWTQCKCLILLMTCICWHGRRWLRSVLMSHKVFTPLALTPSPCFGKGKSWKEKTSQAQNRLSPNQKRMGKGKQSLTGQQQKTPCQRPWGEPHAKS